MVNSDNGALRSRRLPIIIEPAQGFLERLNRECWLRLGRGVVASVREELQGAVGTVQFLRL
jgi:hypothetical protein